MTTQEVAKSPEYPLSILALTATYMAAAFVGALKTGNSEFLFYIVVMLVLISAVAVLHARVGLSRFSLWCLCLWGLAHMAGGLVPVPESWPINGDVRVLYSWWIVPNALKYDQVVHAFGFGTTTLVCWESLCFAIRAQTGRFPLQPTFGLLLLCAAGGMGFGALNEVIEFTVTLLVPSTNVGGYVNTGWDLVSNLVGCIIAVVLIRLGWIGASH